MYTRDAPDPGTVDTDDRCEFCPAGDGEPCSPDCQCPSCDKKRTDWARLLELEVLD